MKNTKTIISLTILLALIALATACGSSGGDGAASSGADMKEIASKKINDNVTVAISNADGKLKKGKQELMMSFKDGAGKPLEIKAATLNFNMPAMGTMAEMNNATTLTTTATPGEFKGSVEIEMPGEWIAQISYEGKESGKTTLSLTAY